MHSTASCVHKNESQRDQFIFIPLFMLTSCKQDLIGQLYGTKSNLKSDHESFFLCDYINRAPTLEVHHILLSKCKRRHEARLEIMKNNIDLEYHEKQRRSRISFNKDIPSKNLSISYHINV